MKMRSRLLVCLMGVFVSVTLLSGCGSGSTSGGRNYEEIGVCFGRVIDRSTRSGIGSATVEIFAGAIPSTTTNVSDDSSTTTNFVARTTTSTDDADTTLFDESGMWKIGNLPTGDFTGYRVRIGATNFATVQTNCTFGVTSSDQTILAEDLGDILMVSGVSVAVNVVNALTGSSVASCPVYALPAATGEPAGSGSQSTSVMGGVEISGTTDASGLVTLSGLNPLIDYSIVTPACDTDADGAYNFQTGVTNFEERIDTAGTFTVAVAPAEADDTPALVASSCGQYSPTESALMAGCAVAANGALTFVFNYPIADLVADQLQLALNDDAAFTGAIWGAAAVDFDGDETVDTAVDMAFSQVLSAGNTVLTVTPTAALSANGLYELDGAISANVPGAGVVGNIISQDFGTLLATLTGTNNLIYAFSASDTAIVDPTIDNYNGDDDNAAVSAICLEFDEAVIGSVQVLSQTAGAVTTTDSTPVVISLNTGNLINEGDNAAGVCGGLAGCPSSTDATCAGAVNETEAIKYVVPLVGATTMADNTGAAAATVTVYVDGQDYAGNRIQKVVTLPVQ